MRIFFTLTIFFILSAFSNANFQKDNPELIKLLKHTSITAVAPASGTDIDILANLENISLKLNIPHKCFDNTKVLFHSNSDELRFRCLKDALFDNSNHVVWVLRGGYGSAKLIPYLQKLAKPPKEKFFIGYSDITALHIFLAQEWGWKPIHSSVLIEILKPEKECSNFIKIAEIISGKGKQITIDKLIAMNSEAKLDKVINGKLTGGNLTMVQTSIGTEWQIKTVDKILFLEDINIKPYQIDRTLLHLKQAGLLKNVKAIIFGSFSPEDENIITVLSNFAATLNIPVFKTNRFGHGKINDPIIYNTDSKIIASENENFKLVMSF
ncbi:LD-carboxypeptidase [Rickettsia endosymbiont of Halotydeus destructor]|uniref:LD-carboxypeptidase n=1 Tax=Rickettsia endosymbiont of Halotydeus destructor TaxID=2996754 RepID=UPI003BAF006A